ncbi:hypothetical protein PSN_2744 [Pseudomonas sp. NGC7]
MRRIFFDGLATEQFTSLFPVVCRKFLQEGRIALFAVAGVMDT